MFKDLGLVEFEKKGRVKMIKLTGEGEEVAHHFEGLRKKFDNLEKDMKPLPMSK
jgi:DNA-binding transcriptional ArsR family regulator